MALINVPQLPNEARAELPPGNEKFKNSRGSLGWWVITVLLSMVLALSLAYNSSMTSRANKQDIKIDKLERKIDALHDTITAMLREQVYRLTPAKQAAIRAETKTDSLYKILNYEKEND